MPDPRLHPDDITQQAILRELRTLNRKLGTPSWTIALGIVTGFILWIALCFLFLLLLAAAPFIAAGIAELIDRATP